MEIKTMEDGRLNYEDKVIISKTCVATGIDCVEKVFVNLSRGDGLVDICFWGDDFNIFVQVPKDTVDMLEDEIKTSKELNVFLRGFRAADASR